MRISAWAGTGQAADAIIREKRARRVRKARMTSPAIGPAVALPSGLIKQSLADEMQCEKSASRGL
jgi:hypothetical protein